MKHLTPALTLLALAAAPGCSEKARQPDDFFTNTTDRPGVYNVYDAYTDAGQLDDGLLYDRHFDGAALNSLGRAKLDAIARAAGTGREVHVHLDLPEADAGRTAAVETHLADAGLPAGRVRVSDGRGPSGHATGRMLAETTGGGATNPF